MRALICSVVALAVVSAQNLCDDDYGKHCPEAVGWSVGDCLKLLDSTQVAAECSSFIKLHDVCKSDIEKYCSGSEYTGDLLPCLTEWNSKDVSEECKQMFPKKAEKPAKRAQTASEKKKADKRRKIRNTAAKMAKGEL